MHLDVHTRPCVCVSPAAGEPVFVPAPGGQEEDDGVVLCTIMNKDGTSFLLVGNGRQGQGLG